MELSLFSAYARFFVALRLQEIFTKPSHLLKVSRVGWYRKSGVSQQGRPQHLNKGEPMKKFITHLICFAVCASAFSTVEAQRRPRPRPYPPVRPIPQPMPPPMPSYGNCSYDSQFNGENYYTLYGRYDFDVSVGTSLGNRQFDVGAVYCRGNRVPVRIVINGFNYLSVAVPSAVRIPTGNPRRPFRLEPVSDCRIDTSARWQTASHYCR